MDDFIKLVQNYQLLIGFIALLVTFYGTFYKFLKKPIETLNERMSLVEESEKAVLTSRIFSLCEDALRRHFTTIEEIKNVDAIFKAYTNYGLNGAAHEIYERFMNLEIRGFNDESKRLENADD